MGETQDSVDLDYLRVGEVAEVMQVPRTTVYYLVRGGRLPAVSFGKAYRVPAQAVQKYLAAGRDSAAPGRQVASV